MKRLLVRVKCPRAVSIVAVVFFGALVWPSARAQEEFYHPELEWKTIETEHFYIHYHDGAERTGRVVAKIAEEIYSPVTSLYDHKPDSKVSFIIKDVDDISNGAAYFYENRIEIFAPSMDFDLRGTHNWLRNVITHEFTHIVQIQTAMKFGRTVPSIYFQYLGYEDERRPDVLYGFPSVIASYPLSGFVVPVWLAEGVAQYNRVDLRYDFWDSHRDMILRSYVLDSAMLGWEEMSVFGKTSLGNESSYNAGFAFSHYLAKRYGEEKLREISRNLGTLTAFSVDGAIEAAVGKPGNEVYDEWKAALEKDYAARVAAIRTHRREGIPIELISDHDESRSQDNLEPQTLPVHPHGPEQGMSLPCCRVALSTGFANLYPAFSPDGKKIAYVSAKNADYMSQSSLFVYDVASKTEKRLAGRVRTQLSWSPDGRKIYYGGTTRDNPHWSLYFDIHVYDLEKEEETRITTGRRAHSPAVSPDGRTIVCVVTRDGTSNLALVDSAGGNFRLLTSYVNGEQVYAPRWSPRGDKIVFDYSVKDGRDLAMINPDGSGLRFLVTGPDDSRSGIFTPDGSRIIYASDQTGIFNLYQLTPETGTTEQITNVLGGAFLPTVSPSGEIAYASYTSGGYKIVRLQTPGVIAEGGYDYVRPANGAPGVPGPELASASHGTVPQFNWDGLRSYDDTQLPPLNAKPYRGKYTSLMVVPFLRVDNYSTGEDALDAVKPGVYLFSNDILDRTGFLASAALNKRLERDLFLQFNYRSRIPLLYEIGLEPEASLELFNVTRKTSNYITLGLDRIPIDVTYNLFEFDFALAQPFVSRLSSWLFEMSKIELRFAHSRYTSIIETFLLPEAGQFVPGSSDLYLIANDLSFLLRVNNIVPTRTAEISPVGRKIALRIGREWNKFNGDGQYEVSSTGLSPVYKDIDFTRLDLVWRESVPLLFRNHTMTLFFRGATILGPEVDDFFDFYAGGMIGMRGYPFYAIGGNELLVGGLEYRFPILSDMGFRVAQLSFNQLYASIFGDIGNAWTGAMPDLRAFKTDIGAEIRLEAFSWYAYPTRVFLSAAYGFDSFDRFVSSQNQTVTYGKEWRVYFGLLFGFDFD